MAADFDFRPKRFATEELPERERLSRWREEFGRTLVGVDVVPSATDVHFWAEAVMQRLPGVHLAVCTGSRALLDRTPALVAADAHAGDTIGLIINRSAQMPVRQNGTELTLGQCEAVLVRHEEACAIVATRHIGLVLPRAALAARSVDGEVMKPISRDNPALRLLINYIKLIQSDPELDMAAVNPAVVDHVHDLAALALGANRDAREQGKGAIAAARLAAAIDYIARHFADPGLTLARVADQQQISPRYLQELLEQSGASFVARVNELRLNRAFALLARFPNRPVSEVAALAGFSNVSHFNRLFRQRFGDSPSGVRGRS